MSFKFTSRYGDCIPDLETVCRGQCEGLGRVPIHQGDTEEPFRTLWLEAEAKKPTADGFHFVRCPECGGTGKRKEGL
jgi:hypothetical protein